MMSLKSGQGPLYPCVRPARHVRPIAAAISRATLESAPAPPPPPPRPGMSPLWPMACRLLLTAPAEKKIQWKERAFPAQAAPASHPLIGFV